MGDSYGSTINTIRYDIYKNSSLYNSINIPLNLTISSNLTIGTLQEIGPNYLYYTLNYLEIDDSYLSVDTTYNVLVFVDISNVVMPISNNLSFPKFNAFSNGLYNFPSTFVNNIDPYSNNQNVGKTVLIDGYLKTNKSTTITGDCSISGNIYTGGDLYVSNINSLNGLTLTTGNISLPNGTLSCRGVRARQGIYGTADGNTINWWWTGYALQAIVDATVIGTLCDYRVKQKINPTKDVLNRLCSVPMYDFKYKNIGIIRDGGNVLGFTADILQKTFKEYPNLVNGEKDDVDENSNIKPQSINMSELTMILMKAIQEQNELILLLSNKVNALENKSDTQQNKINQILTYLNIT